MQAKVVFCLNLIKLGIISLKAEKKILSELKMEGITQSSPVLLFQKIIQLILYWMAMKYAKIVWEQWKINHVNISIF